MLPLLVTFFCGNNYGTDKSQATDEIACEHDAKTAYRPILLPVI